MQRQREREVANTRGSKSNKREQREWKEIEKREDEGW
jgi:hypothetical protein